MKKAATAEDIALNKVRLSAFLVYLPIIPFVYRLPWRSLDGIAMRPTASTQGSCTMLLRATIFGLNE
jgi:hypothetical protein